MKLVCFLLSMFAFSCLAFSQLLSKVQLRSVITDVSNEFNSYRGSLKAAQEDDSTFFSNATIEGSKENEIQTISNRFIQYHAYIADSADKKQAEALVKKWRDKIKTAVPDFQLTPIDYQTGTRKTKGYRFSKLLKPMCNISIVYSKREIDNYYWVLLTITRQGKDLILAEERVKE